MICPKCKYNDTRVLDSRETNERKEIRRRRECEKCNFRFTTFERVEFANFLVIKKDESRELYNRKKLIDGIWKACGKRPITEEMISTMVDKLEEKWSGMGKEISSIQVGEDVLTGLKEIDEIAYIRFASVYKQFKDLETFKNELIKMHSNATKPTNS